MDNPKIVLSDDVLDFNDYKISFEPSWIQDKIAFSSAITGKKSLEHRFSAKGRFKAKIIVYNSEAVESLANYTSGDFYYHSTKSDYFEVVITKVTPFKAGSQSGLIRNTLIEIESAELVECPIKCEAPVLPDGTSFANGDSFQVTMSTSVLGGKIYYTIDGSTPDETDNLYSAPFSVTSTTTIKAIVIRDNMLNSDVVTRTYTENPPA